MKSRLFPGDELDGYRLEYELGKGGMGVVYAARHIELGSRVAIKVMASEPTRERGDRFLSEARAAANIQSDHVARIFAFGRSSDGERYLVMEFLEGEDLAKTLATSGRLPLKSAVRWVLEACEALAQTHARGIVHRDLKPSNLFLERRLDGSRRIKLIDFGIAKMPSVMALTATDQPLGSPMYMAPEQFVDSRGVDPRADVWSLGVVLYEMLTGRAPFRADGLFELARKIRDEPHPPLSSRRSDLPPELERIVDRCLQKHPDRRWADVSQFSHALGPFAGQEGSALIQSIDAIVAGASGSLAAREATAAVSERSDAAPSGNHDPVPRTSSTPAGLTATTPHSTVSIASVADRGRRARRPLLAVAGASGFVALLGSSALVAWRNEAGPEGADSNPVLETPRATKSAGAKPAPPVLPISPPSTVVSEASSSPRPLVNDARPSSMPPRPDVAKATTSDSRAPSVTSALPIRSMMPPSRTSPTPPAATRVTPALPAGSPPAENASPPLDEVSTPSPTTPPASPKPFDPGF